MLSSPTYSYLLLLPSPHGPEFSYPKGGWSHLLKDLEKWRENGRQEEEEEEAAAEEVKTVTANSPCGERLHGAPAASFFRTCTETWAGSAESRSIVSPASRCDTLSRLRDGDDDHDDRSNDNKSNPFRASPGMPQIDSIPLTLAGMAIRMIEQGRILESKRECYVGPIRCNGCNHPARDWCTDKDMATYRPTAA